MSDSEFEQNLYQLRRDKRSQIAQLVRATQPGLTEAAAIYPNSYAAQNTIPALRAQYDTPENTAEVLEATRTPVSIAGRIMAIRVQGKAGFAQLQQGGQRLQIYVRKDAVGDDAFSLYKLLDLGDHIGVSGHLFRTRTGELTIHVTSITFLAKAMLALPDKYHGLEDTELRYRQRYVDLIMNSGTLSKFEAVPAPKEVSSRPERSEVEGPAFAVALVALVVACSFACHPVGICCFQLQLYSSLP